MSTKANRLLQPHPEWCNVPHKVGSSRSRQHHKRVWRSRKRKYGQWRAELYPSPANPKVRDTADVSIRMHNSRGESFWWWPEVDDAERFAHDLLEMVAAARGGHS